jgi:pimeloyl-ACP methyl ester carboxylesterase
MTSTKVLAHALACVAALSIALAGCTRPPAGTPSPGEAPAGAPGDVSAAAENGPAPTATSVRASNGPFRYTQRRVTGAGFASATLYTPTGVSGKTGGILLVPPFMVNNSALIPQATLYASNGFTVLSLNAQTVADFPTQRANQGRAALNVLKAQPNVDSSRLGVGGYSMGGGATMEIISINPDPGIKAGVPQVPWDIGRTFPQNRVPVMILGGSADTVAPPAQHASVFYASIPASTPKGIAIVSGASHFIPSTPTPGMRQLALSWMKYYVDGDSRYKQFITNPGGMSRFNVSGVN